MEEVWAGLGTGSVTWVDNEWSCKTTQYDLTQLWPTSRVSNGRHKKPIFPYAKVLTYTFFYQIMNSLSHFSLSHGHLAEGKPRS